jgi:tetratricopeptide (TPR) repeat protein
MRHQRIAALAVLLLAGVAWAQHDPLADATAAYRKGEFHKAAKLFAEAAEQEKDAAKRGDIRVKLAWTYFAMKNRSKTEQALTAALKDSPQLELVPEYYTDDFLALFSRIKAKLASGGAPPGSGGAITRAPTPVPTLTLLRQRLAQAADNTAVESVLSDLQALEATAESGTLPDLLEVKADALERLGNSTGALELRGRAAALRAAAQAAPGTSAVPLEALLEARHFISTGRPGDAEALLHGILAAQPSCVPALEVLADALLEGGKLDEAYSALKTALLTTEKPDLLLSLGEVELRRGHLAGARDAFRRVAEIDPGNDRAWAALGLLAARGGDVGAAREALDKALGINGTLFEARVVRGEVALADGQPTQALHHIQRALQIRPDDLWAQGWEGIALLATGNAPAALEKLRAAAAASARFTLPLVEALRRTGQTAEALSVLDSATAENLDAKILRARCLLDAGHPSEAQAVLTTVLATSPPDVRAHVLLAAALHAQRRWADAEEELKRAAALPGAPKDIDEAIKRVAATQAAQQLADDALTPPEPNPAPHR